MVIPSADAVGVDLAEELVRVTNQEAGCQLGNTRGANFFGLLLRLWQKDRKN